MGEGDKAVEERSPEGHHQLGKSLSCELLGSGRRAVGTHEVFALASVFPGRLVRTTVVEKAVGCMDIWLSHCSCSLFISYVHMGVICKIYHPVLHPFFRVFKNMLDKPGPSPDPEISRL